MSEISLLLFDHPVSSYAQKVRIVLREKGIPFKREAAPIGVPDPNSAFWKANPRGEVPVLMVSGDSQSADRPDYSVVDSRVICEFLDDRFPEKSTRPKNASQRAKARNIEQVLDTQYEAINWGWGEVYWMKRADGTLAESLKGEAARQIETIQDWLEERIEPSGWLTGPDFGIADAAAGPIVHRSAYFGFSPKPGSKLAAWLEKIREWPSMKETLKEFDENADKMFAMGEAFLSGKRKREYRDYRLEFMVKSGGVQIVLDGLKNDNIRFPWPEGRRS